MQRNRKKHPQEVQTGARARMRRGGQIQTMMPKLHSSNFEGMELIRLRMVKGTTS